MNENRTTDIEMKLMHLENQLEDLSSVVLAQEDMIKSLKRKLDMTEGKIESMASDSQDGGQMASIDALAQDKPPHW